MKILIATKLNEAQLDRIRAAAKGCEVVVATSREELLQEVEDAEVLLEGINPEVFRHAKKLKWVQVGSAGVDGMLTPEFVESDVILTSAKGCVGPHLAEQAFANLLALTRGVAQAVRAQSWEVKWSIRHAAWELTGLTMGIVGLGGTGREVAVRAAAFGMRNIAVDPEKVPKPDCVEALWTLTFPTRPAEPDDPLGRLLEQSDVVCICAPLTQETRGIFNLDAFRRMKRTAILVNVTRGQIVDEESLVTALRDGLIAGAALDVTPLEPLPPNHPLWTMPNVVITPHVAGASPLRVERLVDLFSENLRRFLRGEAMLSVIDKRKGY
ncbi:MAG: D-2-hydroxyacid dehydrogenase [Abditibacteriales bacterium]|nr:D-2-hydroxyacid dehydrogenase [Abditibacteriales bacterium]MDW8368357.1 D-2-hydroxyacid dehydrogenase [Abditibacteriales bacterium]